MDNQTPRILNRIRRIIGECCRNIESGNTNQCRALICCTNNLHRIRTFISEETYNSLSEAIDSLLSLTQNNNNGMSYSCERVHRGGLGRPIVNLTREQLLFFINENYTVKNMASHLNCSISTVYKKIYEENILIRNKYSNISDENLKELIKEIHQQYPNSGSEMMWGYLKAAGITVQRRRVRMLLSQIDPLGTATRWSTAIKRRHYKVPTPNSLWHMDAHLKLSRWGFVIHGCIDGYSRLIVYMSCKTSIQAEPVVNLFINAVAQYSLPSRVRSDHGYENLFVAIFMNLVRGLNRGSHITGKSVHNQRIERLWVDVYKEVVDSIYSELYSLEHEGYLNPENNSHRFCVQYIYNDIINNLLLSFMNGWNHHKIRTAHRKSPRQLWLNGMLQNFNSDHLAVTEIFNEQSDIFTRTRDAFHLLHVDTDSMLNLDVISEPSQFEANVTLTDAQNAQMQEIKQSNLSAKNKYKSCIVILE